VLLAQSTIALAAAVRAAAQGPSELLLLVFTPTILDPNTPELYRANMPAEWAWPAFDRLQLEDYDWVTSGADAARRSAYAFVETRLGYPLADQDYLCGFVLNPATAALFWERIDRVIDEAAAARARVAALACSRASAAFLAALLQPNPAAVNANAATTAATPVKRSQRRVRASNARCRAAAAS